MNDEALRDLASTWMEAGAHARTKKREDVAATYIGCAQALLNLLDTDE